jgi:hypothetical protein
VTTAADTATPVFKQEGLSIFAGPSYPTISQLSERIRTKEISHVRARTFLARIDKLNPRLNAFITVLADRALQEAKTAEAQYCIGDVLRHTRQRNLVGLSKPR